jgi:hypothetical protein
MHCPILKEEGEEATTSVTRSSNANTGDSHCSKVKKVVIIGEANFE